MISSFAAKDKTWRFRFRPRITNYRPSAAIWWVSKFAAWVLDDVRRKLTSYYFCYLLKWCPVDRNARFWGVRIREVRVYRHSWTGLNMPSHPALNKPSPSSSAPYTWRETWGNPAWSGLLGVNILFTTCWKWRLLLQYTTQRLLHVPTQVLASRGD